MIYNALYNVLWIQIQIQSNPDSKKNLDPDSRTGSSARRLHRNSYIIPLLFKGTLSQDFRPKVFVIKQLHLGP
jgi:hypothetical protein